MVESHEGRGGRVMKREGGRGSDRGGMDGRRGSIGGVGIKSSLTWACHRLCPFMCAGR